jgi:hypothetical protein
VSSRCELSYNSLVVCRNNGQESMENLPEDTVAHIQSARCTAQRKRGIGAHNKYRKYLLYAITKHGEAKRGLMMMIIG